MRIDWLTEQAVKTQLLNLLELVDMHGIGDDRHLLELRVCFNHLKRLVAIRARKFEVKEDRADRPHLAQLLRQPV